MGAVRPEMQFVCPSEGKESSWGEVTLSLLWSAIQFYAYRIILVSIP